MRTVKHILVFVLIFCTGGIIGWWQLGNNGVFKAITVLILLLFVFNLSVRKNIAFKPYFMSHWNLFSSRYHKEFDIDLPVDLAFEKLLEVIDDSSYKLRYSDSETHEMLATAGLTWKSWGENIYLDVRESGEGCIVDFCSVAVLGMYTWGKNEENCAQLIEKIEDSLTI